MEQNDDKRYSTFRRGSMGTIAESWADKLNATDNTRAYNRVNSQMMEAVSRKVDVTGRNVGECQCEEAHLCIAYYFEDGSLFTKFYYFEIYDDDHDNMIFENETELVAWLNENEDITENIWIDGRLV